jgi:hypothetical protein
MTRSTITRAARLALALALSVGATAALTSAPAVAQGQQVTSYGKYCGPGVPVFTAAIGETEGRLADLASHWPPADDLDALCYSHDYCFERLGMDSLTCDDAIEAAFQSLAARFQGSQPACAAQATNMAEAFRLKLWSRGETAGRAEGLIRGINNLRALGGNDARDAAVRQAFAEVAARDCNVGAAPDPEAAIDQFVASVRSRGGVGDFAICTPDDAAGGAC